MSPDFPPRTSERGPDQVAEKLEGAVILSPDFGRRTSVVYPIHRLPRTAGVLREVYPERSEWAQDDSLQRTLDTGAQHVVDQSLIVAVNCPVMACPESSHVVSSCPFERGPYAPLVLHPLPDRSLAALGPPPGPVAAFHDRSDRHHRRQSPRRQRDAQPLHRRGEGRNCCLRESLW